jgi:hypothetical protein
VEVVDLMSSVVSSDEERLAAGISTIGLQTKRLSGAQRKRLIRERKTRDGTWTEKKPPRKTPSSQDKGTVWSSGGVKRPHSDSSTPSLEKQQPKKDPGTLKCRLGCIRKLQQYSAWRDLSGHRHGKLFIGRPCKKRADDLLKLSTHQLKMVDVILTGHVPMRRHLYIMGLFNGDPTCRSCRMETVTVQHIICCCKVLARQRYNVFEKLTAKPKDISTASVRDLCLFIRGRGLLNLC